MANSLSEEFSLNMIRSPQVIYIDAVGTLFGVRGSVGEQYAKVATDFNVSLEPHLINRVFYEIFQTAPKMAFPDLSKPDIAIAEYEWWRSLAEKTFSQTGDLAKFRDFEGFFESLYAYFATSEPWFIYEDTRLALDAWQQEGITLGVLSNFDSRIYSVMANLELEDYFRSITISTEIGAAKPDPLIFEAALVKHQIEKSPDLAWHIGDSFSEDYMGACAVGITAFWLNRDRNLTSDPAKQSALTIDKLTSLTTEGAKRPLL